VVCKRIKIYKSENQVVKLKKVGKILHVIYSRRNVFKNSDNLL